MIRPCRPPAAFFGVPGRTLPYPASTVDRVSIVQELPAALHAVPFGCTEMRAKLSAVVGTAMFVLAMLELCVVGCLS